ncbi:hypothetical protein [Streptococcus gallolyticus]|uniref:hypothetical protein n=1 Tax=Streptococcus gallolyticus TaxID=315405 RepID=UPI0022845C3C|nr:hypothetical protein [Streptococcus gallolyticus]MCY7187305.1 hypothetical protein [Streptococcus gallolyticus subsp. gallolyticus]
MSKILIASAKEAFIAAYHNRPFGTEDYIVISITDYKRKEDCPVIFQPAGRLKEVYRVPFIDIPEVDLDPSQTVFEQTGLDLPVFSFKEARVIREIGEHASNKGYNILIHCEAGVSRSQAMGACLELYLNQDPSMVEIRIHGGNFHYFKTFFEQFEDKWKKLSQLKEPIYQERKENLGGLFGWSYKMDDFEKHLKRPGAIGPDYPREHMLTLTDRYLLQEVLG